MKTKALLAALLMTAGAAHASVISNGNFEAGLAGWTSTGNVLLAGAAAAPFYFGAGSAAQNGTRVVAFNGGDLAPNGVLSQTFATVAGATYSFSFDFGATQGGTQSLLASILGANGLTTLNSLTVSDNPSTGLLTRFGFNFVADGATARIEFRDLVTNNTNSLDGVIDNVSVVPEPSSIALLGLAAAALLRSRRRKV